MRRRGHAVDLCEGVQNYRINTNLSARVSFLNPSWNEDVSDEGVQLRFKVGTRCLASSSL